MTHSSASYVVATHAYAWLEGSPAVVTGARAVVATHAYAWLEGFEV